MAVVYAYSPWNLLLVLIPLGLVHVSLRNYMKLRHETKKTFESVVEMLHARDPYTFEHSKDVAQLATAIAQKLKLHQDQVEQIRSAALIHDIGKLGIPDSILKKPGPLTDEEWELMKRHPDIGADLIKDLEIYRDIVDIVRYEHERWDGSGYPKGLKGEEIPIGARVVAAADIYHALTTDRPYRPAYSHEEALQMIRDLRGETLDPQVVDALLSVLEGKEVQVQEPEPEAKPKPESEPTSPEKTLH
jgi:putative nucleotidyltransferase with HDIG domain